MRDEEKTEPDDWVRLAATSLSLALLLMIVRTRVISFDYIPSVPARAGRLVLAAYYDFVYVAAVTAAFLGFFLIARRNQKSRRALFRAFLGIALVSLLAALANVKVVPMLGRPMNYQWLYYSDFLRSQDARNAIFADLSGKLLLVGVLSAVGLVAASLLLSKGLSFLTRRLGRRRLALAATAVLLIYFLVGGVLLGRHDWPASRLENPIVSFARSVVVAGRSPRLLTMKTSVGSEDFAPQGRSSPSSAVAVRSSGRIRNVIFVVLESVPAEYVEAFGGPYPVTSELGKYRGRSELFTNIYAHCPTTSYSLVSLLLSIYPRISYQGLTEEQPAVPFPSLSSELKRRGYRTAFFSSADLRHQQCDLFLSHREFDKIEDYRSLRCDKPVLRASTRNWPFLNGKDDSCTADALADWINSAPDQPYFAVFWTMMTHYPYFAADGATDFGVAEKFNRYLNALRHDDQVLGKLFHFLEEHHLDKSTLVVVVGDHGEAFGQHHQWSHARCIYEENVHVPLMLINPELFHGESSRVVGGLIDLAPTVLDILDLAPPARWQGRSLWSANRSGRVYFFAPWSDHLFGLRENDTKVIYNAEDNHFEIYNLAEDPHETTNRARQVPEAIGVWQQRLAAWVQYQTKMMRELEVDRGR